MKAPSIHPHISEFDRIDALPTLAEVVTSMREILHSILGAVPLTWR